MVVTDLDYGDDKRASVPPNEEEEDKPVAEGDIMTAATAEDDRIQLTQTSNPGEAIGEDTTDTHEDKDDGSDDKKYTSPRDGSVLHDPAVLTAGRINKSVADHVSIRVVQQIIRVHLLRPS